MLRRICLYLCAVLLINTFVCAPVAAAENSSDIYKQRFVLNRLGIVENEMTDDLNVPVNRAKFAGFVVAMLNMEGYSGDSVKFVDVQPSHSAFSDVNLLADMGIINGTTGKSFEPERHIKYEEACKMLVCAMGYDAYKGVMNINEYKNLARKIGIDISPRDTESLYLDEVIEMIYKAMSVEIPKAYAVKGDAIVTGVNSNDTMFSVYHNVIISKGQVNTIWGHSMTNSDVEKDEAVIGGDLYKIDSEFDIRPLFGRNVEYLYIYSKEYENNSTIIYAENITEEEKTLSWDLLKSFDKNSYALSYYKSLDNNGVNKAKISRGAVTVYNGRLLQGALSEVFNAFINGTQKGSITLISTKGTSEYDLLIIRSGELYIASGYDTNAQILYSDTGIDPRDLSEYEVLNIHTPDNVETTIPTIFPVVLGIELSDDGYMADITVYSEQKKLTVDGVLSGGEKIKSGEAVYKFDKQMYPYFKDRVNAGGEITVIVDKFGEIAYVYKTSDTIQYGYLRGVSIDKQAFDANVYLHFYMNDKEFHMYELADKVKIDNKVYSVKEYTSLLSAFPGEKAISSDSAYIERQVVAFKLNDDSKVKYIDTYYANVDAGEDPETTLARRADGKTEVTHIGEVKRFGFADIYDNNTLKFTVPKADLQGNISFKGSNIGDSLDMYSNSVKYPEWAGAYTIECYYMGVHSPTAAVLILLSDPEVEVADAIMFDHIESTIDKEGEICKRIYGYCQGSEKSYYVDELCLAEAEALTQGDIFRVNTSLSGEKAMSIIKQFDAETETFENQYKVGDGNPYWYAGDYFGKTGDDRVYQWRLAKFQLIKTYPYLISGTYVFGAWEKTTARDGKFDEVINTDGLTFTVYDKSLNEGKRVYSGTLADLSAYSQVGQKCSTMLLNVNTTSAKQVFVFK